MAEFIVTCFIGFIMAVLGFYSGKSDVQERCVAYHADMPHNKVNAYCEELLKFETKK